MDQERVDAAVSSGLPTFGGGVRKKEKKARLCNLGLAGSGHNVQPCRSQWKIVGGTRRLAHCPAGGLQPRGDPMRCNCTRRKKGKKMTCRFSVPSCNFITKSHSLEGRIGSLQILFLISGKHIWSRNEVEIIEATRDVYGLKTRVMSQVFTAGQRGARSCIVIFFFKLCTMPRSQASDQASFNLYQRSLLM